MSPMCYLYRALSLLYPIECPGERIPLRDNSDIAEQDFSNDGKSETQVEIGSGSTDDDMVDEVLDSSSCDMTSDNVMRRPVRQATLRAKEKLKNWLNPSESFICVGSVAISIANMIT